MKTVLLLPIFLFCFACSNNNLRYGSIPAGMESQPTVISKYIVSGAFFDQSRAHSQDYSEFASQKCRGAGYQKTVAWILGEQNEPQQIKILSTKMNLSDTYRDMKIWCKD